MAAGCRTRRIPTGVVAAVVFLSVAVFPAGQAVADGRRGGPPQDRQDPSGRWNGLRSAQAGQVTPEKLERWRAMTPEERGKIRERYRRWKDLPPERRESILERRRAWRELPEDQRRYLMQRREIYRNAHPEERRAIEKVFRRWRQLPPERRHAMRQSLGEWRRLPEAERNERMKKWAFYRKLSPGERKAVRRFLFSEPPPGRKDDSPALFRD